MAEPAAVTPTPGRPAEAPGADDPARLIARLSIVNEAGRALLNARGYEETYRIVHDAARRIVAHDVFYIGLFGTGRYRMRVDYYVEAGRLYPPLERTTLPPLAALLESRLEPLLMQTPEELLARSNQKPFRLGDKTQYAQSALFVPLINEERVLGVFSVQSYRPYGFDAQDVEIMQLLANQAAAAIENARLWRSQHEALAAHRTLAETARALHATLDDREVAQVVARELRRVVPCRRSLMIMLLDETRRWFEPVYADGVLASIDRSQNRAPSQEGICGHVLRTRLPYIMQAGDEPPFVKSIVGAPDSPASLLAVPLVGHRKTIGAMVLTRGADEHAFAEHEADLALLFADQAATAIENARLYQLARTQADLDPLTGLLNHRAMHEALDHHVKLARRVGRPLAVMMLDLDRFKALNDTYGHLTGDWVLQQVAARLKATCRETDLVARYGGEEFAVVVPDTDEAGALVIAERIREAMVQEEFVPDHATALKVRLSGGIATCPSDGVDAHTLLKAADERLYLSKRRGGNAMTAGGPEPPPSAVSTDGYTVVDALIRALEGRNHAARWHAERVSRLAVGVADRLALTDEVRRSIHLAALLLDVGAAGLPAGLLDEPRRLTDEEMRFVRQHPAIGASILTEIGNLALVQAGIRAHHERWDGSGYPDRLSGDTIPVVARILAVADTFAAMTEDRPHRPAHSLAGAIAELRHGAGTRYDPRIVNAFLDLLDGAAEPPAVTELLAEPTTATPPTD